MKLKLMSLCLVAVSTLGLISCRQDKSVPDSWDVQAPTVKSASHQGRAFDLHSGFSGELPADSLLNFESSGRGKIQSISVHSRCVSEGQSSQMDRAFGAGATLGLAALLPKEILLAFRETRPQCVFTFVITDDARSTRSFTTKPITITDLNSLENTPLQKTHFTVSELSAVNLAFDLPASATFNFDDSFASLACESFQNTRPWREDSNPSEVIQELAADKIYLGTSKEAETDPSLDSRYQQSVQRCRLVVIREQSDEKTDLIVSSAFTLEFPISDPEVHMVAQTAFAGGSNLLDTPVLQITIQNLDPVPVQYAIRGFSPSFTAETAGYGAGIGRLYYVPQVGTTIQGFLRPVTTGAAWTNGGEQVIEVPGYGSTVIVLKIQSHIDCAPRSTYLLAGGRTSNCQNETDCTRAGLLNLSVPTQMQIARASSRSRALGVDDTVWRNPLTISNAVSHILLKTEEWSQVAASGRVRIPVASAPVLPPFPYCQ